MSRRPPSSALDPRAWLAAAAVWTIPAILLSTQQWAELRGGGKEMSWLRAFSYQAPSWLLLVPATPLLLAMVRRWPIDRGHPGRAWGHLGASLVFGGLFLLVAVPVRHAFHPSPVRWTFFGEAFYKSAPQFIAIGVVAYWAIVLVGSLLETRQRLAATIEERAEHPGPTPPPRVTLATAAGATHLPLAEIAWIEAAGSGARVHAAEAVPVRHTLAELESLLAPRGFVRTHRSCLVNASRIREVVGAASRDGTVRLDTGDAVPVARRRRATLDAALARPTGA